MNNNNYFYSKFSTLGGSSSSLQLNYQYNISGIFVNFGQTSSPNIDFLDFCGVLSPTTTNNSAFPILHSCFIKQISIKYLDTTAFQCSADWTYAIDICKLTSNSGVVDNSNLTTLSSNLITLNFAEANNLFFKKESSSVNIELNPQDILVVKGTELSGSSPVGNEEVMCNILMEQQIIVN